MTFDEFKQNVETWAKERGIYKHSTPEAQLLKALSELGELADAMVKNDMEGIKDGVGDVVVCMVNYAHMVEDEFDMANIRELGGYCDDSNEAIGLAAMRIGRLIADGLIGYSEDAMATLMDLAEFCGLKFLDCCEHAWNQIKDRKGRMVPGGAFIKD